MCLAVEDEIRARGGGLAFPVQSSRNAVAAHYCAPPGDATEYAEGDLAKLDIGVHVDGWVVDTATTVAVGGGEGERMVRATAAALEAAIAQVRPGVPVRRLSEVIEATIRSYGLVPVKNLCGHGVGRWLVHTPPPIPNLPDHSREVLPEGAVVAIEPFATFGAGHVRETGPAEVFRYEPRAPLGWEAGNAEVMQAIRGFNGLPFARRQLAEFPRERVEAALQALLGARQLASYPPLVESGGRAVAQAEHTVYVGSGGVEVLTR